MLVRKSLALVALGWLAVSALAQTTGLTGRVVQSDTRAPVSGVKVRASFGTQITGPDGRFSFRDLTPGRYLVEVIDIDTYLPPPIGYVATLTSGQVLGGIEIELTPLASVQGKVVDGEGLPVGFAAVKLIPKKQTGTNPGNRDLGGSSGRDGSFKIGHVPPGEYDLVVRYSASLASIDQTRDARHVFRPTYYPAGATRTEARSVIVKAGGAVGRLVITVRREDPVRVQGRVMNIPAPGRPEAFRASFASDQEKMNLLDLFRASAPIRPDGSFEISGVLPGKTHLYLMTLPEASDGYGLGVRGSTTVDVPGKGLEGALLPFYASDITVKGRVVQENGAPAPLATRIEFDVDELLPILEGFDATTDANGEFQIQLMRRKYSVLCRDLRSLSLDGNRVTGTSLDFSSGPAVHALEVRMSSARGTVKGKVMSGDRAAPQAYVRFTSVSGRTGLSTKADQNGDFVGELPAGEYHVSATRSYGLPDHEKGTIVTVVEGEPRQLRLPLTLESNR